MFFIFSLLGNATYGAGVGVRSQKTKNLANVSQILFHSTGKEYFLTNLPWLIGSLGTMIEDITIFVQFRIYAIPEELENSAVV